VLAAGCTTAKQDDAVPLPTADVNAAPGSGGQTVGPADSRLGGGAGNAEGTGGANPTAGTAPSAGGSGVGPTGTNGETASGGAADPGGVNAANDGPGGTSAAQAMGDAGASGGASGGEAGGSALSGEGNGTSGGTGGSGGANGSAGAGGSADPQDALTAMYEPITAEGFDELPLFDGDPPNFKANAPAETVNAQGSISNVSVPTLRRFAMESSMATGFGYIVFPGGAYTGLDMDTHATRLAERVGPQGIAVFAVKYRVGDGSNDAPRDALLDAKRGLRMVKENAPRWGVNENRIGVIGYSAGSHLVLNLIANLDAGDNNATDPIERHDSRPAFVGSMSTWAFYEPTSPFTFPDNVPPVYFCHAQDDTTAPIALAREVEAQISAKGAATMLDFYQTGGHSTCHPGDERMEGHNWPDKFLPWLLEVVGG
jgi:acetyl esterase/lipase